MWGKFLCRFGWHMWTQWDEPRTINTREAVQYRKCIICNKQQRNIF